MAIGASLVGLADARHVARRAERAHLEVVAGLGEVEGPAQQPAARAAFPLHPARLAHEGEGVGVGQAEVEVDQVAVAEGVEDVEGEDALGPLEPAHLLHLAVARHDADPALQILLVGPVVAAGLQPLDVGGGGEHREDGVPLGDGEVVHGRAVGLVEPLLGSEIPVLVGDAVGDVRGAQPAGLIAEEEHLAGDRIDAGVGGHGLRAQGAVVVPLADGLQRVRVDLVGAAVFLGHEQPAGVPDGRGVGDGAVQPLDRGVVGEGVAVAPEQGLARLALGLIARGAHIFDVVVDRAVLDEEAGDHPVTREHVVVFVHGGVGRVRHGAEEGALHLLGDLADDGQVADRGLDPHRRVQPRKVVGLGERRHCCFLLGCIPAQNL